MLQGCVTTDPGALARTEVGWTLHIDDVEEFGVLPSPWLLELAWKAPGPVAAGMSVPSFVGP